MIKAIASSDRSTVYPLIAKHKVGSLRQIEDRMPVNDLESSFPLYWVG